MNFIFDLYGTLVDIKTDEESDVLWEKIADELCADASEARNIQREYLSLCAERKIGEDCEIDLNGVFEDLLSSHGKDKCDAAALAVKFRELATVRLRLFCGVYQMLCKLKQAGAGVYLLSNAQACFTVPELDRLRLTPLFDGIVISSDVGFKKPSRRIFEIFLDRFRLSAENCIYVGNDMRDDILGASSAGLRSIYIHTEQSGRYDGLDLPCPTYTAQDHSHLSKILLSLAQKKEIF